MELRNIERAKELIPELERLREAKRILAEATSSVLVRADGGHELLLPKSVRMNVLNAVNCEYERVRKEVSGL